VAALGGEPGVHSARYAGEPKSDARNNEKLVHALAGQRDRRAHYYCVIVLVRHAEDPEPIIAEGRWHGEVIDLPRGAGGFGYDPYFLLPALGRTAAELGAEEKNAVSHRGKALRRLLAMIRDAD
jgi:XTP/dITP diphosphohydrolase